MSLIDDMDYAVTGVGKSECKPDYQKQAAQIKSRLDEFIRFKDELKRFSQLTYFPSDLKRKEFNWFELYGYMEFLILESQTAYDKTLKRIEQEKADGTK